MCTTPTHALSGAVTGLAVATLAPALVGTPLSGPVTCAFMVCTAGAAILPDLDHPSSATTRSLGPITGLLSTILRTLSRWAYQLTGTSRDTGRGTHRALSHTILFAAALGWAVTEGIEHGGPIAAGVALFVAVLLALRGLPPEETRWTDVATAAVFAGGIVGCEVFAGGDAQLVWLGPAFTLGCLTHCLGDAVTEQGVPLLWPLPLGGRTWYPIGTPRALRFPAGGWVEHRLVRPALWLVLVVVAVLQVPGVLPALGRVVA